MQKRLAIALTSVLFLSSSAQALEVQEALISCYENNEDIKSARQTFLNEIESFPQALAKFLPDISASISKSDTKSKDIGAASSNNQKNLQKAIVLNQSIFNGGGDVAALKAAQEEFKSAMGKYYASEQDVFLKAVQTYVDCYYAQETFNIFDVTLESYKKQLNAAEESFKLGEATTIDVATAQAGLAKAQTNKLQALAKLESAKATFAQQIGIDPIDIKLPEIPNDLPNSLDELQAKSMINPSIYQARHILSASRANEWSKKSQLLPSASFQVQAGKSYNDPQTSNKNGLSVTSTLSLQIPIYSKGGAVYSNIRQAKNRTRLYAINLDKALKIQKTNCISTWANFDTAKSSIYSATTAVNAAQISYDGTTQEQFLGSKTMIDVIVSLDQLNQVKLQKVNSEAKYILSAYEMQSLIGQLTAKSMKLKVKYFNPENEFKKMKFKIIGS